MERNPTKPKHGKSNGRSSRTRKGQERPYIPKPVDKESVESEEEEEEPVNVNLRVDKSADDVQEYFTVFAEKHPEMISMIKRKEKAALMKDLMVKAITPLYPEQSLEEHSKIWRDNAFPDAQMADVCGKMESLFIKYMHDKDYEGKVKQALPDIVKSEDETFQYAVRKTPSKLLDSRALQELSLRVTPSTVYMRPHMFDHNMMMTSFEVILLKDLHKNKTMTVSNERDTPDMLAFILAQTAIVKLTRSEIYTMDMCHIDFDCLLGFAATMDLKDLVTASPENDIKESMQPLNMPPI